MQIRTRLMRAISAGSLLVAVAAGGTLYAMFSVNDQLDAVKASELPTVSVSSKAAMCASDLATQLGDLVDARVAGNSVECDELNASIPATFDAMDGALVEAQRDDEAALSHHASASSTVLLGEVRLMSDQLRRDWRTYRSILPTDPDWDGALAMDDRATGLVSSMLKIQDLAVGDMTARIDQAIPFIRWVERLAGGFACAVVAITFIAGLTFARRLAARLDRVRNEAMLIGTGDLSARVNVLGTDEVDQVSIAFNDMAAALQGSRAQLEHDALHDSLTGLPNRALFKERLERRLAEAARHDDYNFAIMFMDLDRFKLVNDSLGHAAGDALLRNVADRIGAIIDAHGLEMDGTNTLARLGGDEFTVLLERIKDAEDALSVARSIKEALAIPQVLEGHELMVTTSIGIAIGSPESRLAKEVMGDADAALYRAKAVGRDGAAVFESSMRDEVVQRLRIENDLRRALERREFILHFQPILDLTSGQLIGFEALIRWCRGGELIRPDIFIPIAEDTGQIVQIGEWVIEEACAQFHRWRQAHGGNPRMLSVNVSRRQLIDANLVPHLKRVLAKFSIPPSSLIVEITESMLGEAGASTQAIAGIRALGVLIYIDDFGTGYSTLGSLHGSQLDGIKIDKSFVSSGSDAREQTAVLNTVIQLAHSLGVPVIAEGIETPAQLALLQSIDCDRGQGFHFAKPLTAADAERMLMQIPTKTSQAA